MNNSRPAVEVTSLCKTFVLPQHRNTSLKQTIINFTKRSNVITQTVLDDISFEVNEGDFFGIVGRNGSGKSTLLKILAGVYSPTKGGVTMNGRLTPFIELGVGFNPELSGRDNVFLNGALLGFTHKDMEEMYEDIVDFAELEPFMDQKLKNYSSGMQVRLAFSIAIKAKNEILIFDEVLAVGDEAFQRKCFDIFEKYKAEKQTLILVTHDMETVKKFCNRAMLLNNGRIMELGDPRSVAEKYSQLNQESTDHETEKQNQDLTSAKHLKVKITDVRGHEAQSFSLGDRLVANISWGSLDINLIESIGISIFKQSGEHVTGINSRTGTFKQDWRATGKIALEFKLDITPGKYFFVVEAFRKPGVTYDALLQGPKFTVKNQAMEWSGIVELSHKWRED